MAWSWAWALLVATVAAPSPAAAAGYDFAGARPIDLLWITASTVLVVFMQLGFLLVEAGGTRSKNTVNVAVKNVSDIVIAVLLFPLIGATFMFGSSVSGVVGFGWPLSGEDATDGAKWAVLVFFAIFASTAATIMAGAVAERFSIWAYIAAAAFVITIVFPIYGHWVWGDVFSGGRTPWLSALGFHDFAGGVVVHVLGGCVALAAAIRVGPRIGRYRYGERTPQRMPGHSPVTVIMGGVFLLVGWFGFNAGSSLRFDGGVPILLANTLVGGVVGAAVYTVISVRAHRAIAPDRVIYGLVAGLAAVTAGADMLTPPAAALLGAVGALAALLADHAVKRRRVDDVVSAFACHAVAGGVGAILFPLLAPAAALPAGGVSAQIGVQALGVATAAAWGFGLTWLFLGALNRVLPLRVPRKAEIEGLNSYEHDTEVSWDRFAATLRKLVNNDEDFSSRVFVEAGEDHERIAQLFNHWLDQLERKAKDRQAVEDSRRRAVQRRQAAAAAEADSQRDAAKAISTIVMKAGAGELSGRIQLDASSGVLHEVAEGVNGLIGSLEQSVHAIAGSATNINLACDQLNTTSGLLHKRSASQIDSVQTVTFKLGALADAAESNASVAEAAIAVAEETDAVSRTVGEGVAAISDAIDEIERTAQDIAPVVTLINDIAMQTRLLALNASVEAARAGQAGRAFSVVAQEVRELADNSGRLAEQISAMVGSVSQAVGRGVSVVRETSGGLGAIHVTAEKVGSQIKQLHASSSEQRDALSALREAVESITEASTSNAQLASNTAKAAETLSHQGQGLLAQIAQFDDAAAAAAAQALDTQAAATPTPAVAAGGGGAKKFELF